MLLSWCSIKYIMHINCSCRVLFDPKYFIQGNCLQSSIDACPVRYKMKFQHHTEDGNVEGSSHMEEREDGTFKLVWARKNSEPSGVRGYLSTTKLDIVRPGRYIIMIVKYYIYNAYISHRCSNNVLGCMINKLTLYLFFLPTFEYLFTVDMLIYELRACLEYHVVNQTMPFMWWLKRLQDLWLKSTIHTYLAQRTLPCPALISCSPDGRLSMPIVGEDYKVCSIRKKVMKRYQWKDPDDKHRE